MKKRIRVMICALVVSIMNQAMSINAVALSDIYDDIGVSFSNSNAETELYQSDVITEDESLREANVKHFRMTDGTYKVVTYPKAVHRKDKEGKWQDIDNRMYESLRDNKPTYISIDGRSEFSKRIDDNNAVVYQLCEGDYSIRVSIANVNVKRSIAKLLNHAPKYIPNKEDDQELQYERVKNFDNSTTLTYKNIMQGIDLEYILDGNDIKENIIVKEKATTYEYSFFYQLDNLLIEQNEDGSIILTDKQSKRGVYYIPAPYMYDVTGAASDDVYYSITNLGNDCYLIDIVADKNWIDDENRAFPVTIDPTTISMNAAYSDTYIDSLNPNTNYGMSDELWISSTRITYMKYLWPTSLPYNATITNATLNAYYYYNSVPSGSVEIGLYVVNGEWGEFSHTWNKAHTSSSSDIVPYCFSTATAAASLAITEANPNLISFNVTDIVRAWYAGATHSGIALKYEGGSNQSVILKSNNAGGGTRAYYEITYELTPLIIENGVYFLKNDKFDLYMQINDDASNPNADGMFFELWDFDGASDQKWEFQYMHGGYYKITSVCSGKALTAPDGDDTVGDLITQMTYQAKSTQLWKITDGGNGTYKISAYQNSSHFLSAGSGIITGDGRNIRKRTSQSDGKDEWHIQKGNVYLEFSYDLGFIFRNQIGTESIVTTKNRVESNIETYFEYIYTAFSEQCDVYFMLSSITNYTSDADTCFNAGIVDNCTCVENNDCKLKYLHNVRKNNSFNGFQYTNHCKSIVRLRNNMIISIPNETIRVTYTGHSTCYYSQDNIHSYGTVIGLSDYDYPIICMTVAQYESENRIVLVLAHELTHLFGVEHHERIEGSPCIMDKQRYDGSQMDDPSSYWCDNCINAIKANKDKY